ncbi:transcriptional regulator [Bacillus thuringiensis serovar kyushuensis]|uniref:helix-turn-helix domain-containing protein n=1 Tax=Bacillus thuringiensis TaxID=1428 RepID=UPI000B43B307|nr:helix-turn-helix transcriptional regulator [Bacillus thuringiensis]MEC2865060.1 helix-turn-helix transcriptional regulator [Bacillus cereus]OTZ64384.1 transcriptional regulator [Bacillus thuringiensis serovar kyushuensis]OTZ79706.1 transcriptional regulator [Bacillus thuringiensis serovar tohokuensis]OUB83724.1 transcriptional regulator [Bacillus thuringiensis serovar indiana]
MRDKSKQTELQKAFKDSGLKYHELAQIIGVSKSHCYKIINWDIRIYYDIAVKIANAFGKEASLIFQGQQKKFGEGVANNETKV